MTYRPEPERPAPLRSLPSTPAPDAAPVEPPRLDARRARLCGLLDGIAAGDSTALAALYDETNGWVYGLAMRILSDHQVAEEVTLDVFVQVWQRAGSYLPERGHPGTWLMAIARNRALDRRRARRSRERGEELAASAPGGCAECADPAPAPYEARVSSERESCVRRAIAELPEAQRTAIELAYFPGLSHAEIAERLGEPLGTIKTRIRLALRKLKDKLQSLEEDR